MPKVLEVKAYGAGSVAGGLDTVGNQIPSTTGFEIRKVMERSKRVLVQQPPQRQGQKYVRTQTLVSNWQITNAPGKGIVGHGLMNGTTYSQWVVGNEFGEMQAWMHKNRWPVFRDVVEEMIEEMPDHIKNNILLVAGNAGLLVA